MMKSAFNSRYLTAFLLLVCLGLLLSEAVSVWARQQFALCNGWLAATNGSHDCQSIEIDEGWADTIPLRLLADRAHLVGDDSAAQALYEASLTDSPNDSISQFRVGLAQIENGDVDSGLAVLRGLPGIDLYFLRSAENAQVAGDLEEAATQAGYAVQTTPNSYTANVTYGRRLRAIKQYSDSLTYLNRAAEIHPTHYETHIGLGELHELGFEEYETALNHYQQAYELSDQMPLLMRYLARTNMKLGHLDLALQQVEQSAYAPYDYYLTAEILSRMGNEAAAIPYLETAIERQDVAQWRQMLTRLHETTAP